MVPMTMGYLAHGPHDDGFDFIECFLHAHSWLNWVDEDDDEDEVGLKEKPEDTRYIKRLHQNKTRSTGSVDKGLN